jgi:hypothetical protein
MRNEERSAREGEPMRTFSLEERSEQKGRNSVNKLTVREQLKLAEDLLARIQKNDQTLLSQKLEIRQYFSDHERGEMMNRR